MYSAQEARLSLWITFSSDSRFVKTHSAHNAKETFPKCQIKQLQLTHSVTCTSRQRLNDKVPAWISIEGKLWPSTKPEASVQFYQMLDIRKAKESNKQATVLKWRAHSWERRASTSINVKSPKSLHACKNMRPLVRQASTVSVCVCVCERDVWHRQFEGVQRWQDTELLATVSVDFFGFCLLSNTKALSKLLTKTVCGHVESWGGRDASRPNKLFTPANSQNRNLNRSCRFIEFGLSLHELCFSNNYKSPSNVVVNHVLIQFAEGSYF